MALTSLYPDALQLMKDYSADKVMMTMCITDLTRIYEGSAPTLHTMREAYGLTVAASWVEAQLEELSRFAKVTEGLTDENVRILSHLIIGNYSYLRLSEFMYFIGRVMMGKYGYFYGSVDPMRIMSFLNQFLSERKADNAYLEKKRHDAELMRNIEERRRIAVTYKQYRDTHPTIPPYRDTSPPKEQAPPPPSP